IVTLFCLIMLPRQPRYTIFPYTTLFRSNMVEGAKELPGKIGSAIKNMAYKAVEGITSLGKSMGDKMESVVNSVIGGLNKVLGARSEEHTSELQSRFDLVCRLLLEKKNKI